MLGISLTDCDMDLGILRPSPPAQRVKSDHPLVQDEEGSNVLYFWEDVKRRVYEGCYSHTVHDV